MNKVQGATNFSEIYVPVTNTRQSHETKRCRKKTSAPEPQDT